MIKSSKNTRTLKVQKHKKEVFDDKVLENFYTTHADFAKQQDSYLQVYKDKIRIFDPDGKHTMTYCNFKF